MSNKPIQITEFDLRRLQQLLEEASHTNFRGREDLADLSAAAGAARSLPRPRQGASPVPR